MTHARHEYVDPLEKDKVPMPFAAAQISALQVTTATALIAIILKICADNRGKVVFDICSFELVNGSMDILRVIGFDG